MHVRGIVRLGRVAYQSANRLSRSFKRSVSVGVRAYTSGGGTPGAGAGRGGGAGGSIKESGGGLGKFGAAQEEGYFFNKNREQLMKLKKEGKTDKPKEATQKPEEQ